MTKLGLFAIGLALAACKSHETPAPTPAPVAAPAPAPTAPAAPTLSVTSVKIDVDANGLAWDAAADRLVIADARGNRLAAWTPDAGVTTIATLPALAADEKGALGQPVYAGPKRGWLVPKFGFGTAGTIYRVTADGKVAALAGLDPKRRRIGMAVDAAATPYVTWFTKEHGGPSEGGVSAITPADQESDLATALKKPVGIAAVDQALVIVDQEAGALVTLSLADATHATKALATLPSPDLLAAGPAGTVLVSQRAGGLAQVALADGKVAQLATDHDETRGLAYDPKTRRAFLAIRPADKGGPTELRIVQLPTN